MDMDLLKNGSGIKDPTAYKAIKSLEGDNVKEFTSKLKKGDICEYMLSSGTIKKCVVVSDGQTGMFIPIIVLTDEPKFKFSVPVFMENDVDAFCVAMYANINVLSYAHYADLKPTGQCASYEDMYNIGAAIVEYLDIKFNTEDGEKKKLMDDIQDLQDELSKAEEMYKNEKSICDSLQKDLEAAATEREEYKKRIEELTVMLDCERANTIENSKETNAAKYIIEKYEKMFEIMCRKVGA